MYLGTLSLFGDPRVDTIVTTTNAWQTLEQLLGQKLINNGQDPVAALFSIKLNTNDAVFDFGGTAEHPLVSTTTTPASAMIQGAAAVKAMRLKSDTAGSAATVSVTVFY